MEELSLRVSSQLQGSQLGVPSRVGLHYLSDGIKINHHKAHPLSISYPNLHVNKWGLGVFRELIASPELSPLRKGTDMFKTKFKPQISKQNREKVLPIRCLQRKRCVCPKKPRAQVRVRNLYYLAEDTPERWGKLSVPTYMPPSLQFLQRNRHIELVSASAQLCPPPSTHPPSSSVMRHSKANRTSLLCRISKYPFSPLFLFIPLLDRSNGRQTASNGNLEWPSTFFLGPGSLRSDRYLPNLKVPGTGPRRKPAGIQQSAFTLVAGVREVPCIVATAAWQTLGLAGSSTRRE